MVVVRSHAASCNIYDRLVVTSSYVINEKRNALCTDRSPASGNMYCFLITRWPLAIRMDFDIINILMAEMHSNGINSEGHHRLIITIYL